MKVSGKQFCVIGKVQINYRLVFFISSAELVLSKDLWAERFVLACTQQGRSSHADKCAGFYFFCAVALCVLLNIKISYRQARCNAIQVWPGDWRSICKGCWPVPATIRGARQTGLRSTRQYYVWVAAWRGEGKAYLSLQAFSESWGLAWRKFGWPIRANRRGLRRLTRPTSLAKL